MQSTNYLGLITFNANGIVIANYQQVRATLVQQFKNIYGSDIDLSTNSADGIYVETLSLIINNILQVVKMMYSNLDTRTATGQYLDILCALTNVIRKPATKSTVYVTISGLSSNAEYGVGNQLQLLDKNGTVWTCAPFTADVNGSATVLVTCNEYGPIRAEVGWIDRTVEMLAGATITMESDAEPGSWRESDAALRARRDSALSMRSTTVLEGITSALFNVSGIEDIQIYNNDTSETINTKDTTQVLKNDVYIAIRKNKNITIDDSIIGSIIYEKKTPGVHTTLVSNTAITDGNGISKTYNYPNTLGVAQVVRWKECKPIKPQIVITVKPENYFVSGASDNSTATKIANEVMKFMNSIRVSQDAKYIELQSVALFADPKYRGVSTYSLVSLTINNASTDFVNPDTYFEYTTVNVTGIAPDNVVITIS